MSTQMKKWKKVPSVMTGGQPFFYTRYDADTYPYTVRQSIIWDRQVQAYEVRHNDTVLCYCYSVDAAKQIMDKVNK